MFALVLTLVCLITFFGAIMSPEIYKQTRKSITTVKRAAIERSKPKPFPQFTDPAVANDPRVISMRNRLVEVYEATESQSVRSSCLIIMESQLQKAVDLAIEARTVKYLVKHLDTIEPLIDGLEQGRWAEVAFKINTFENYLKDVTDNVVLPNALDLSNFKAIGSK